MKTTARNAFWGTVTSVRRGAVNGEVQLEVSPQVRIVSIVTLESIDELGLEPGRQAMALINSSFVVLAAADPALRTSAGNQIPGRVIRHQTGAVNDEVSLRIDEGHVLTATVAREGADALGIGPDAQLQALVEASHVILVVE
jgi:molybdate transport system regulatory protein